MVTIARRRRSRNSGSPAPFPAFLPEDPIEQASLAEAMAAEMAENLGISAVKALDTIQSLFSEILAWESQYLDAAGVPTRRYPLAEMPEIGWCETCGEQENADIPAFFLVNEGHKCHNAHKAP